MECKRYRGSRPIPRYYDRSLPEGIASRRLSQGEDGGATLGGSQPEILLRSFYCYMHRYFCLYYGF